MNMQAAPAAAAKLDLPSPYLVYLGDIAEPGYAKTGFGLRDWARDRCIGEYGHRSEMVSLDLPFLTPAEAIAQGARALVIGVANVGGVIPARWMPHLLEALDAGLDLVAGLHNALSDVPALRDSAARLGRRLIDVRRPPSGLTIATGRKRSGKRLLTIGTDCALGKKYTALTLARAFALRGTPCDFRATGQTGIMIAGRGVPLDAVVADFAAGAAELLSPDAAPDHWDVIEGQGSLLHPAYAAVSLALLHGSQPDVLVVCHMPDRGHLLGLRDYSMPSIEETADLALRLGRLTNPAIRWAGVSLNTSALSEADAADWLAREADRLGMPVADPIRGGEALDRLVEACLE